MLALAARETGQTVAALLDYPPGTPQGLILTVLAAQRLSALDRRNAEGIELVFPVATLQARLSG